MSTKNMVHKSSKLAHLNRFFAYCLFIFRLLKSNIEVRQYSQQHFPVLTFDSEALACRNQQANIAKKSREQVRTSGCVDASLTWSSLLAGLESLWRTNQSRSTFAQLCIALTEAVYLSPVTCHYTSSHTQHFTKQGCCPGDRERREAVSITKTSKNEA